MSDILKRIGNLIVSTLFKRPVLLPLICIILTIIIVDSLFPVFFLRNHYTKHLDKDYCFKYLITDSPKQTAKTHSYTAKIIGYYDYQDRLWKNTCGKIKIYIPKYDSDSLSIPVLHYGDVIVSSDQLYPIVNLDSSSVFNYARYMRHKRIYHQVFIHSFRVIDTNQANGIVSLAKKVNIKLSHRLQNTKMQQKQKDLATALLLGDKKDLDTEIKQQFNTSGLAHILCVSGLHIIMIVSAISFLLKRLLPHNLKGIIIRNICSILLCWIIAGIVGFTPSAMRVATMVSMLIIARFTALNGDMLNTLFATAFIFLCFDPLLLFNISFQLSFLAVGGIIVAEKRIRNFILRQTKTENIYLKRLVHNISTTTSAQIFTFPVIMINFGRFPVLFLISNVIVLPFIQLILISVILLLICNDIPLLNNLLAWLCNTEMSFLMFVARLTSIS